jgi:hypothetical protein
MNQVSSRIVIIGAVLNLASACSILPDNDPPTEGRVVVEASPQAPLQLIVSTDFTTQTRVDGTVDVTFESSDTVPITGAFDRRYPLAPGDPRIVAVLGNYGDFDELVRLRVLLDGEGVYDVSATLTNGGSLQYTYSYRESLFNGG